MDLPFMADMMFVLNNSDVPIYLYQGAIDIPSTTFYDLQLPAKSYTILDPHGGFQFSALLNNPSEMECYVIFAYGYADEYRAMKQILGDWDWYLPPLIVPNIQWYFDWDLISYPFCEVIDLTLTDADGVLTAGGSGIGHYTAGVGYVSGNGAFTDITVSFPFPESLVLNASFTYVIGTTGISINATGCYLTLGGGSVPGSGIPGTISGVAGSHNQNTPAGAFLADGLRLSLQQNPKAAGNIIITAITITLVVCP